MKILITGSSEGIGFETAKLLAAKGNQITLVARNKEKLDAALAILPGSGHEIIIADISKREDAEVLKTKIADNNYGVFINNAGIGMYGRFTEMPLNEQMRMIDLNVSAVTALSYAYLAQAKKGDALINLASTLGSTGFPSSATYAGTKAFVTIFSESLWWEYKSRGVYVASFSPGVTDTAFHKKAGESVHTFPQAIIQTPAQVASELVTALEKRNGPKIVSGFINRSMLFFYRFFSRKAVANIMGGFSTLKD